VAVAAVIALGGGTGAIVTSLSPAKPADYHPGIDTGQPAPVLQGIGKKARIPTAAGLEAALGGLFGTPDLGSTASGSVMDAETGELLWQHDGTVAVSPASTAKLITGAAVLATRGPDYRIATKAVAGPNPGDVVLVGGGDPTLAAGADAYYRGAARLDLLAQQVKQALGNTAPARVLIDTSLFTGPTAGPSGAGDVGSAVCNITALMINGGRVDPNNRSESLTCSAQPDVAAGQAFAQALGVSAQVASFTAAKGAKPLGEVDSPPISSIVEQMLVDSDNGVAEMMAHQVALAKGLPASFAGGVQATATVLAGLGVPTGPGLGLEDGSGLSYGDKVTANQLSALLAKAASPDHPELRALLSGLPVAGYSGTLDLKNRDMGAGKGAVRAKTGTLTGVNALAGYVVDADGRLLVFAAIGNGTGNATAAEHALDHIAEGVSTCGCR
jgi:D-alanyl-D-alanine carboxypeptidase/D-alanyl-D-alanine-endopeptidase (penicillin-binding protein 4)